MSLKQRKIKFKPRIKLSHNNCILQHFRLLLIVNLTLLLSFHHDIAFLTFQGFRDLTEFITWALKWNTMQLIWWSVMKFQTNSHFKEDFSIIYHGNFRLFWWLAWQVKDLINYIPSVFVLFCFVFLPPRLSVKDMMLLLQLVLFQGLSQLIQERPLKLQNCYQEL